MATTPKRQIGTMACLCCGHTIPVKAAENGTINAACPWCDFPAYAKAGTEAHRIITGKLQGQQEPTPAAKPQPPKPAPAPRAPEPTPAPIPAKRRVSTIFDLGASA